MCVCVRAYMQRVCVRACAHACVRVHVRVCVHVHGACMHTVCVHVCESVCVCVCEYMRARAMSVFVRAGKIEIYLIRNLFRKFDIKF